MDSLSPECTPLKHRYDSCFNAWFEGYLQPVILTSGSSSTTSSSASNTPVSDPLSPTQELPASTTTNEPELIAQITPERSITPPPSITNTQSTFDPRSTIGLWGHGHSLREDDTRSHPDLFPFLSRHSTPHSARPDLTSGHPVDTLEGVDGDSNPSSIGDDDEEEEVEELPESSKSAIEQTFGPEDSLFDLDDSVPDLSDVRIDDDIEKVEMPRGMTEQQMREERARLMRDEYEKNCGGLWTEYRGCLQRAIDSNQPLSALLDQARQENPLEAAVPLEGGGFGAPGSEP